MKMTPLRLLASAVLAGTSFSAMALPVTIFGPLPVATFGGSGIPNNAVQITTLGGLTLGLTATQRFGTPTVTNDGAGTFFATAGLAGTPARALWNFDYYIGGNDVTNYTYRLLYDFDPGFGTPQNQLGILRPFGSTGLGSQNSENLTFGFLDADIAGVVTQPTFASFDANAGGQYSFALIATDREGTDVARSDINVNVAAVPEPASFALLGLGLVGLLAARKRKQV